MPSRREGIVRSFSGTARLAQADCPARRCQTGATDRRLAFAANTGLTHADDRA